MASYTIKVTATHLHVRSGPGTNYNILPERYVPTGKSYTASEKKTIANGQIWYKISSSPVKWICGYKPGDGWYVKDSTPAPVKPTPPKPKPVPAPSKPYTGETYDSLLNKTLTDTTLNQTKLSTVLRPNGTPYNETEDFRGGGYSNSNYFTKELSNYKIDASWTQEYMDIIKRNSNLYVPGDGHILNDYFTKMNRFKIAFPDLSLDKTFSYVFFTRPDLNLFSEDSTSAKNCKLHPQFKDEPNMYYLYKTRKEVLLSLSSLYTSMHDFNVYLSNQAASFELQDEYIKTVEHGETFTGYKMMYGKNNIESKTAGTFNINFQDDNELNTYKMHKCWVDYISKVYRGEASPKRQYIVDKTLDYAVAAYYILCGPDGETVLFWSKYYGVFPTVIPSSNLSWSKGGKITNPEYNISYTYSFKEDLSPFSLAEFNMNSRDTKFVYRQIYNPTILSTGRTFTGVPFIDTVGVNDGDYVYKLRFRNK